MQKLLRSTLGVSPHFWKSILAIKTSKKVFIDKLNDGIWGGAPEVFWGRSFRSGGLWEGSEP